MKTYRIKLNVLEEIGAQGEKVFQIVNITPDGIEVLDEADNGVEIKRNIKWNQIK